MKQKMSGCKKFGLEERTTARNTAFLAVALRDSSGLIKV